jgi:hypothetical protein
VVLDFIAVIFSGVTGLLPVFAHDILHLGPDGLGYLRAAIQLGSVCAGLLLAHYPMRNYVGRQYVLAVVIFCMCLLAFAYSTSFYLSFALLFLSGFFDWYGSVIRGTISRLLTPEALQGRVTLGASNVRDFRQRDQHIRIRPCRRDDRAGQQRRLRRGRHPAGHRRHLAPYAVGKSPTYEQAARGNKDII